MADEEQQYRENLKASGIDVPEPPQEEEATPNEEAPASQASEEEGKGDEHLQDDTQEEVPARKRTIYDEYKEKKAELKSEKEQREQLERERDELQAKLQALSTAGTPKEQQEASDDLTEYAKEIDADPKALAKLRDLILKDAKGLMPEGISKEDIEELKAWKAQNSQIMEQTMFENEYKASIPALKRLFPKASDEELSGAIRSELDKLSHSKEYHDKPLDYVAFRHQEKLSALISPRKRGMESKGKSDVEAVTTDFDPTADFSRMTVKERETWEKNWREMVRSDGIATDGQGRKIII